MIFVTVGTQLAFDRMIAAVDDWAGANPDVEVQAQIGPSKLRPRHVQCSEFLRPQEVDALNRRASLIVGHAGMGSILTALRYKKPIVIMPRKASLGEHRNDHQMATAKWLGNKPGVFVAWDERHLKEVLGNRKALAGGDGISEYAPRALLDKLSHFIGD